MGREYVLRGRGYVRTLADLEASVVAVGAGGTPVRLRNVARVQFGPEIRRGAADWNGRGEAVGGIVVMRIGWKHPPGERRDQGRDRPAEPSPGRPHRAELRPLELIRGSVATLRNTLIQEGVIVTLLCLVFLFSVRSAFVAAVVIPIAVLLTFIPAYHVGMTINIMSLAGIAIAVGELEDASTTFVENGARHLSLAAPGADRRAVLLAALKEVGRPTFFSLVLVTVSFIPLLQPDGPGRAAVSPVRAHAHLRHLRGGAALPHAGPARHDAHDAGEVSPRGETPSAAS